MKCSSCGGTLSSNFNLCPYCGTRADVDFQKVSFRDLGPKSGLPCPDCAKPLTAIEFQTDPPIAIERCDSCFGSFFNPGEIELLLEHLTNDDALWVDEKRIANLNKDRENEGQSTRWAKCPICNERMSPLDFGGESGIILDQCRAHGFWVENGEFRQIAEWWHAGGKFLYEKHQEKIAKGKAPLDEAVTTYTLARDPRKDFVDEGTLPALFYSSDRPDDKESQWSLSGIFSYLFR